MSSRKAQHKNTVVISGAYGLGNPGDEAILKAVLGQIRKVDPHLSVSVLSRDPKETAESFGVRSLWSFDIPGIIRALKGCRLFISGGGSLVQDVTSRRSLLYYLLIMWMAKKAGCSVVMYGCGIGPVRGRLMRRISARIISSCVDRITLRDEDAKKALKELGADGVETYVSGDPVLSLDTKAAEESSAEPREIGGDDRFVVFCLRKWPDMDMRVEMIARAAENLYKGHGLKTVLVAACREDAGLCDAIRGKMNTPCRIVRGRMEPEAVLQLLGRADAVISSRLHFLLFASLCGTPPVALSYDPKVSGFMSDLGTGCCADLAGLKEGGLEEMTEQALRIKRTEILERVSILQERERINLSVLSEMLGSEAEKSPQGKLRLAFFTSDFGVGGMQKSLINLLKNLDISRCSADVYYSKDDCFYELPARDGIAYIKCRPRPYWYRFVYFRILKLFFGTFAPEKEYDIAVDFNSYQNDCALMAVCCRAKHRVMLIHNDVTVKLKEEPKYRVLWHFFRGKFRYYDGFVAVSPRIVDGFRRSSGTDAPVITVPNYIDTDEIFRMAGEASPLKVDGSMYNICAVGRLCHQKGFDILLDIFAKAASERSDLRLYIIGDGPDRELLRRQAAELGIADKVCFSGTMENPYSVMDQMDALVLTSRYEGQGMVVLEAKALGLDLFVSENLEGCNPGIPCCKDICAALLSAEKHEKQRYDLKEYNDNITRQLAKVFEI